MMGGARERIRESTRNVMCRRAGSGCRDATEGRSEVSVARRSSGIEGRGDCEMSGPSVRMRRARAEGTAVPDWKEARSAGRLAWRVVRDSGTASE